MISKEIGRDTWIITRGEGHHSIHNYLLVGSNKAALIDTGLEQENLNEYVQRLTDKPVLVIHTHAHIDHIGNDQQFDHIFLCSDDLELYRKQSSSTFRDEFFQSRNRDKSDYISEINQKIIPIELTDGMDIDLGNRTLHIIKNPGHTKGSISVIDQNNNAIYIGDMISEMGVLMHFDESTSLKTYIDSLKKIKNKIDNTYKIFPGHQQYPLSYEWIDRYINCAKKLIESNENDTKSTNIKNEVSFYDFDGVKISYKTN